MKTISNAKFELLNGGVQGLIEIENSINKYEISFIINQDSYGGKDGLWEIAVFPKDDWQAIALKCLGGRVSGFNTLKNIENLIKKIQKELKCKK